MLPLPLLQLRRPRTVSEAVAMLDDLGADAQLIAGGTDVVPNMKQGLVSARTLVSLRRIEGLSGVRVADDGLHIGAMTTLDKIASHEKVRAHALALAEAAGAVGGPHHRRMGTLGGNLCLDTRCRYYNQTHFWRSALGFCLKKDGTVCHVVAGGQKCVAAASNDTAPALIALEASIVLESTRGRRAIDAKAFYTADGIRNTVRDDAELVTEVIVPIQSERSSGFEKLRRRNAIDFPLLSVAARVDSKAQAVGGIDVVVSALAARPRRLSAAQKVAQGTPRSAELVRTLATAARKECRPLDNIEGDAEWRHEMVTVMVTRLLQRLGVGG